MYILIQLIWIVAANIYRVYNDWNYEYLDYHWVGGLTETSAVINVATYPKVGYQLLHLRFQLLDEETKALVLNKTVSNMEYPISNKLSSSESGTKGGFCADQGLPVYGCT